MPSSKILLFALAALPVLADPVSLVTVADPISCFNRMEGAGTLTTVPVTGQSFTTAIDVKTGAISATANAWDIRPRCFATAAANQNDVVGVTFWVRAVSTQAGKGFTSFVVEQNVSPYTKSVNFTAAFDSAWKKVEIPFNMAQTYAAASFNLSFWATYPNQEIQIGGFSILDYGPNVPYSSLGFTTWPYDGHAADAPWRADAAARIEKYRKGDIVVIARDASGNPVPNAPVHVKMKRHAFGFGTAVAGDALQRAGTDGDNYRQALTALFNKAVTENALKWPFYESWGRTQDDFMLPWFAANNIQMVRGHNVIWPNASNLPADVQAMLKANPVDQNALRTRIYSHIADVMSYTKGKVTEWDVLNEPYTSKDVQAVLGNAEMAVWFQKARVADPNIKLYINDYNILEAGGYDLQHINFYYSTIQNILAGGGPIDGIGLQSHFDSNLTPPTRVLELLDQFAAFGKDLEVTEFDINVADDQLQADYTRDFLTTCFSHPAIKGFMIWGFWEGAHWLPQAAMIRKDWSTKANYAVWKDLIYNQWWTDVQGTTAADGTFRTRGFLGDYSVDVAIGGKTTTLPLTLASNSQPVYAATSPASTTASVTAVVNGASFATGGVAPGEIVTVFGSGFGPAAVAVASYDSSNKLPTSVGDTRVLFDNTAAPMIYSVSGQTSAIVPYAVSGTTQVQVEYQGVASAPLATPVATSAPGIFLCANKPNTAVLINASAGGKISCADDFVPPAPGDVVTFFVTGEGAVTPAPGDGVLPGAPYPAPVAPWSVSFGGVQAQPCAASFIGLIFAGVTQVNACVPAGVPRRAGVQLALQIGQSTSQTSATVDLSQSWKVIWSDEFNGAAGTPVDSTKWTFDLGGGGWGNQELEVYTNSTDNVYQDGKGNLVIQALKTASGGYTSARIKTQGKFDFTYGKVEARIKIPYGQGLWPAFWMLGNDISKVSWPACGEIDIMENIGKEPAIIHGTVHGPGYSGGNGIGGPTNLPSGRFADDYHVYGVQWSETSVAFYLDGNKYFEVTPAKLPAGANWVYQHPFFLLLNVAVGGGWPGNPDTTTVFPQQMLVDWVRVSQLN